MKRYTNRRSWFPRRRAAAGLMITCLLLFTSGAASWPEFRGPTGQGLAPEAQRLPVTWSQTRNIAWKTAIGGQGWSSPVLLDGRVYVTSAVPLKSPRDSWSLRVQCLHSESGDLLWEREVFRQDGAEAPSIHSKNSHASPTPVISDGHLYVHFGHHGTACLDLNGKVVWRQDDLDYHPVHGNGGSPTVVQRALVFSIDGRDDARVVALDRRTGRLMWKAERRVEAHKKFSFSTPLLIAVNGRQQLVSAGSNVVCALQPRTGTEIWRVRYDGYSVTPRPVFGHGMIFISTGYDAPEVLAIRVDGQGDVSDTHVAWRMSRGAPNTPSLLLVGTELYMVSDRGVATCVDARSGRTHWQQRLGGNYSASPVSADGKIYFQSEEGEATVIAPGTEFRKLATNDLGERTLASYAIGATEIYIRSEQHLYRIEETTN